MLTKKDFIKQAKELSEIKESDSKEQSMTLICQMSLNSNPRFNEQKFRQAAYYKGTLDHLKKCLELKSK